MSKTDLTFLVVVSLMLPLALIDVGLISILRDLARRK